MTNRLLVVRFPNGSWSHGGKETDPDYDHCDKFWIESDKSSRIEPRLAIKTAQARYKAKKRKEELARQRGEQS